MSGVECRFCGAIRKIENVGYYDPDGDLTVYQNSECWNCGAPGWESRGISADPVGDQPVPLDWKPTKENPE